MQTTAPHAVRAFYRPNVLATNAGLWHYCCACLRSCSANAITAAQPRLSLSTGEMAQLAVVAPLDTSTCCSRSLNSAHPISTFILVLWPQECWCHLVCLTATGCLFAGSPLQLDSLQSVALWLGTLPRIQRGFKVRLGSEACKRDIRAGL